MMVSTRSASAQTKLEDFATEDGVLKAKNKKSAKKSTGSGAKDLKSESRKRKSNAKETQEAPTNKRRKQNSPTATKPSKEAETSNAIIINRAPVLQLCGASVAQLIYPELSWDTCLSVGSAISTICALAKGRSIGTVPEKDESEEKQKTKAEAEEKQKDLNVIEVMHFKLKLKDGLALVGSEKKGKPAGGDALKKKFGEQQYEKTRAALEEALGTWKDDKVGLNQKAFGMYEQFRPTVSQGQKGWGRKGELDFDTVRTTVER